MLLVQDVKMSQYSPQVYPRTQSGLLNAAGPREYSLVFVFRFENGHVAGGMCAGHDY